jgi:signal transduction histidine kinase
VVDAVIRPAREILTVAVFVVVAGILGRRVARAGPMLRRALVPVAAAAAIRAVAFPDYFAARRSQPDSSALAAISWVEVLLVSLIPLAFAAGFVLRRLHGASALRAMAGRVPVDAGAVDLRDAMAGALEDPSLRIFERAAVGWVDESGLPVGAPRPAAGRDVTEVATEDRELAVIETDATLAHDGDVLRAAAAYATIVLENGRLVDELLATVAELSESRARIAAVADDVRRQIERDLHDGAQQRLVALCITLGRGAERLRRSAPEAAALLERLGEETEATIDEVRALAHGIYPSLLADRGLPDALHAAVLSAPIDARLSVDHVGRYPAQVENTVYFACLEALQNAEKHAGADSRVDISVWENGALGFDVSDDGRGFDTTRPAGAGLTNLHDRMTAVGGQVVVESSPGHGTRVHGRIPVG